MRAVVIGAGYVGAAVAWTFRYGGYDVKIIDDRGPSGSRASLGLWREGWWESDHLAATLPQWWSDHHRTASEEFLDYLDGVRTPLFDDDLGEWSDDPLTRYTLEPRGINGAVERIVPTDWGASVIYDGGKKLDAEIVVVCAGVRNIELLEASPGIASVVTRPRSVRGRSWKFDNSEPFDARVKSSPWGKLFAIRTGPYEIAVGSSYEDDLDPSGANTAKAAQAYAQEIGSGPMRGSVEGLREVGPDGKLYVWQEEPGRSIYFAGGVDRFGLGLAGGLAEEIWRRLGL